MNKNFLQDVIPPTHKRSIKDIPLPKHKQQKQTPVQTPYFEQEQEEVYIPSTHQATSSEFVPEKKVFRSDDLHTPAHHDERIEHTYQTSNPKPLFSKNKKRYGNKVIVGGLLIGFITAGIIVFGKTEASIVIKPNKSDYTVDTSIVLNTPTSIATKTLITKNASRTVPATEEQQIEQSAQGKIRIINKHKETPQELVAKTRFKAPNGLIYRIKQPIEIPGYKMTNGTLVPGTLEVEVYADDTGEKYNISNTTFTIPGFEGMEQFEKITAETVGDITGGYIGIRKVVTEDTKASIETEIKKDLEEQMENLSKDSSEYVLVPDLDTLSYSDTKDEASGSSVTLTISATVSAYSIPKQSFSDFIGQNTVASATPTDSFVVDTNKINIIQEEDMLKVSGQTSIAYNINPENIKTLIAGKKRSEIVAMKDELQKTFTIVDMNFKPLARSFPSNASKIQVTLVQ